MCRKTLYTLGGPGTPFSGCGTFGVGGSTGAARALPAGTATYCGAITVGSVALAVNTTLSPASIAVNLQSAAALAGTGTINGPVTIVTNLFLPPSFGTLAGNFTINGPVAVNANGRVLPGDGGPCLLTVSGPFSLAAGATYVPELQGSTPGPSDYDQLLLLNGSTATIHGTLSAVFGGSGWTTDCDRLYIVRNNTDTTTGTFSNFPTSGQVFTTFDGRTWAIYYGANALTGAQTGGQSIVLAPVPEPGAVFGVRAAAAGLAAAARRLRRRTHAQAC